MATVEKETEKIEQAITPPQKKRGRPRGVRNRKTREILEAVEKTGETPLQYMLRVMRDPTADDRRRDDMAAAAAPYVHPRLANLNHSVDLRTWTDEQIAVARAVLIAVTAG